MTDVNKHAPWPGPARWRRLRGCAEPQLRCSFCCSRVERPLLFLMRTRLPHICRHRGRCLWARGGRRPPGITPCAGTACHSAAQGCGQARAWAETPHWLPSAQTP